jgi:hypothetical protein
LEQFAVLLLSIGLGLCFLTPLYDALIRIAKGIRHMADLEVAAISDLTAAVDAAVALIDKLAAAAATAVPAVDHSADIAALKQKLAAAVTAAAPPAPAAAPAPAAPAA